MLLAKSFMKLSDLIQLSSSVRMLLAESFMELSDLIRLCSNVRMLLAKSFLRIRLCSSVRRPTIGAVKKKPTMTLEEVQLLI